jgi:hypothetical protein
LHFDRDNLKQCAVAQLFCANAKFKPATTTSKNLIAKALDNFIAQGSDALSTSVSQTTTGKYYVI